jgi:spermidine/putrescine transport system permease protein
MNPAYSKNGRRGLIAFFLLLVAFLYAPIAILVIFSFNDRVIVSFPWEGFTLNWYRAFLANDELLGALATSLEIALMTAIVTTVLAIPASVALVRRRFRGKGVVSGLLLAPLVVPLVVLGISLLILFNAVGLPMSRYTVAVGHVVIALPFAILTVVPRLERIPPALEEASRDLGGGAWQTFKAITMPLLAPAIVSSLLIAFTVSFDEIVIASFINGGDDTFPVYLFSQLRLPQNLPQVIAVAVIILVVSTIGLGLTEILRRRSDKALEATVRVDEDAADLEMEATP